MFTRSYNASVLEPKWLRNGGDDDNNKNNNDVCTKVVCVDIIDVDIKSLAAPNREMQQFMGALV